VTTKGKLAMEEKSMGENDIRGLEEEIDSAVDRLFVEKQRGVQEGPSKKSPSKEPSHIEPSYKEPSYKEPSYKMEQDFEPESSIPLPSTPASFPASIDKMESQLLSLEWEITRENLGKTREEVLALRQSLKEKPDIISVLSLMEKVLDYMSKNEERIRPPFVKFLLDSKETIKLLMKKEMDNEVNTYKQLAYVGLQARYSCLEELKEAKPERAAAGSREETERAGVFARRDKQIQEMLSKIGPFWEKIEEMFRKIDQRMLRLEQRIGGPSEQFMKARLLPMNITVLKVEEKLFGVESDKVLKLFKVPSSLHEKYSDQQIIRLKGVEVRLIDLKKVFSIQKRGRQEEMKILTVKDNGEHKGLMIDQVLERLSTQSDVGGAPGDYFLGTFHWVYRERPMDIPILDLKKF
jgi:hypothetical protein